MSISSNKTIGHQAEHEAEVYIAEHYPDEFFMNRTGLDTGHDLRGRYSVGEVKRVKSGPAWLSGPSGMIPQLDQGGEAEEHMHKIGFLRLTHNGKVKWYNIVPRDEFTALLRRAAAVPPSPLERGGANDTVQPAGEQG